MAVIETAEAELQADFFQVYVNGSDDWDDTGVDGLGYEWRLWSRGSFAYVGTGGQHPLVRVAVEVHDAHPGDPGPEWDHVASTSVDCTGTLGFFHWDVDLAAPPPASVQLEPGSWRMRVHWADLVAADGGDPESLRIQVWRAPWSETTLDRCFGPWLVPAPTDVSPDGRRQVEVGDQIQLRCAHLEPVGSFEPPAPTAETGWRRAYPPMPGGGASSRCHDLKRDQDEGSWWVSGVDVRETVREVSPDEAAALQADPHFVPIPADHLAAWREHRARQRER